MYFDYILLNFVNLIWISLMVSLKYGESAKMKKNIVIPPMKGLFCPLLGFRSFNFDAKLETLNEDFKNWKLKEEIGCTNEYSKFIQIWSKIFDKKKINLIKISDKITGILGLISFC